MNAPHIKELLLSITVVLACIAANAGTTQPALTPDNALDDIFAHATAAATQPTRSTAPTSQPASPFGDKKPAGRAATLTLSSGEKITGPLAHTANKPLRMWVEKDQEYHDIPFEIIQRIDVKVLWERQEAEWHFKESGSDIKEFNGKSYPNRLTEYTFTLANGQQISGAVVEPLYVLTADGPVLFALRKRDKGEVGQTLRQLVYVKSVEFK